MPCSTRHKSIAIKLCIVVITTTSASGCLHALGIARPSIGPRASLSLNSDSTVRAQDRGFATQSNDITGADGNVTGSEFGHSGFSSPRGQTVTATVPISPSGIVPSHSISPAAPKARLLAPQFGNHPSNPVSSNSGIASSPPNTAAQLKQQVQQQQQQQQLKSSLGFNAANVREFLNSRSQSEMATGKVLTDRPSKWEVLGTATEQPPTEAAFSWQSEQQNGVGAQTQQPANALPTKTASLTESTSPDGTASEVLQAPAASNSVEATPVSSASSASEPSMLDKLKGFYPPATENAARKIWKRPFPKLSNPWAAVFGDREEPTLPDVDVTKNELADQPAGFSAATAIAATPANELLMQLIDSTVKELNDWPRQINGTPDDLVQFQRRQQDLRLLYLIANQPGSAIQAVDELPPVEQDFWQELMLAIAEYRNQDSADREVRFTNTTGQLRSAARQLSPLTSLQVRRFEICSRIHSFGRIDTFPSNVFDPVGQPILLYAEVENFSSELTADGTYRTRFEAQLKLFAKGDPKAKETIELPNITDEASSERSDYFQSFELNLPSHLQSGEYAIRLRLRDRISGKIAESIVEFQIR